MGCGRIIVLLYLVILCAGGENTTVTVVSRNNFSDYETFGKERSHSSKRNETGIEMPYITSQIPTENSDDDINQNNATERSYNTVFSISLITTTSPLASELVTGTSIEQNSIFIENNDSSTAQTVPSVDESTDGLAQSHEDLLITPQKARNEISTVAILKESDNIMPTSLWDVPNQPTTAQLEDDCLQYTKCQPDTMNHWYCGCDGLCQEYNDCCFPSNTTTGAQPNTKYVCMNNRWPPIYMYITDTFSESFFVIAKCTPENMLMQEKCDNEDFLEAGPPVFSKYDNTIIYKNKYCAICNNESQFESFDISIMVRKSELIYTKVNESYTNSERINFFLENGNSYAYAPPEGVRIRPCNLNIEQYDSQSCQKYNSPVSVIYENNQRAIYRNIFCSQATDGKINRMSCFAEDYEDKFGGRTGYTKALSVMFSFTEQRMEQNGQSSCDKWTPEIRDKGICLDQLNVINVKRDIKYHMKFQEMSTDFERKQLALLTIWIKHIPNIVYIQEGQQYLFKISENVLRILPSIIITKRSFLSEVTRIVHDFQEQKIHFNIEKNNTYYSAETIEEGSEVEINYFLTPRLIIGVTDNFPPRLFSSYKIIVPKEIIIKEFCSDITITVKHLEDDFIQVETVNCQKTLEMPHNESTLSILTYIFCGISVVSLVILIVCYRKKKLYMDVPSSNLENIAISMMTANFLFMCGIGATKLQKVCYAVGIALHYVWLASFSFTSLAVIYIVSTLLKLRARRIINKNVQAKQRRVITVVGLLIPILFVGPAVVTDQYGPEYLSPGYGHSVCFPTQFPGNLIFFSGPVMVSILLTSVCLITVMIKLHVVSMATSQVRQSSTYRQGKIYLRLIALSGVFWITGIFAVLFRSDWLEYAFTFLCGLHGFFLSVANLTTFRAKRPKTNSSETSSNNM